MAYRSSDDDFAAAGGLALGILVVVAVLVLALGYLLVKAIELVVRMLAAHPQTIALRVAVGCFLLFATFALLSRGQVLALNVMAVVSFLVMVLVAKVLELYCDKQLQQQVTREVFINDVLRRPWIQLST